MENIDIKTLIEKNKMLENQLAEMNENFDLLVNTLAKVEKQLVKAERDSERWYKEYLKAGARHQWYR